MSEIIRTCENTAPSNVFLDGKLVKNVCAFVEGDNGWIEQHAQPLQRDGDGIKREQRRYGTVTMQAIK